MSLSSAGIFGLSHIDAIRWCKKVMHTLCVYVHLLFVKICRSRLLVPYVYAGTGEFAAATVSTACYVYVETMCMLYATVCHRHLPCNPPWKIVTPGRPLFTLLSHYSQTQIQVFRLVVWWSFSCNAACSHLVQADKAAPKGTPWVRSCIQDFEYRSFCYSCFCLKPTQGTGQRTCAIWNVNYFKQRFLHILRCCSILTSSFFLTDTCAVSRLHVAAKALATVTSFVGWTNFNADGFSLPKGMICIDISLVQ